MPSVEELVKTYQDHTDEELLTIHHQIDGYTTEAKKALNIILSQRGGLEKIQQEFNAKNEFAKEVRRIQHETRKLYERKNTIEIIVARIDSALLSHEEITDAVISAIDIIEREHDDQKVKPRTIIGGVIGGLIGGTLTGVIWGVQMIYSHRIFAIFAIGVVAINYACIVLFTKQSKKNPVVYLFLVISSVYTFFLGGILYEIFGYLGL